MVQISVWFFCSGKWRSEKGLNYLLGVESATSARNQLISKTDIVIFDAILQRLQSFDFNDFTIIVKEMSCSRAYRFCLPFFSFLRATMREKANPWFSNTTKILTLSLNKHKLSIFYLFSMFILIFYLKLNARITLQCLQQHGFSYFSYFRTYTFEWQKKVWNWLFAFFMGCWIRIMVPWPQQRTPTALVQQCSWRKFVQLERHFALFLSLKNISNKKI